MTAVYITLLIWLSMGLVGYINYKKSQDDEE